MAAERPAAYLRDMRRTYGADKRPWDYCGEHLYGRWVEDGKVFAWRLVRDEVPS